MARPDWQSIENAYEQPAQILDALRSCGADCTELRSAERHLKQSYDYCKEVREKVRYQEGED